VTIPCSRSSASSATLNNRRRDPNPVERLYRVCGGIRSESILLLMSFTEPVVLECGERIVLRNTSDHGLGVTVCEAFRKTRTREGEALEHHLQDGATLQVGRARLIRVSTCDCDVRPATNRNGSSSAMVKQPKS
jgi:hypothetical protein